VASFGQVWTGSGPNSPASGATPFSTGVSPYAHSATENISATQMYGNYHFFTVGDYTGTLPTASLGMNGIFAASGASPFSIDCQAGDHFVLLDGTVITNGNKITSDGTANATVSIICPVANTWVIKGQNAAFIDGGS